MAAAGLPLGSTSNHFRTRQALLVGVLRRILERETAIWTRLAVDPRRVSIEAFTTVMGRALEELTGGERVVSRARRTVFVELPPSPTSTRRSPEPGTSWPRG